MVFILIRLMPLVIAIVTGFGLIVMSIVDENATYGMDNILRLKGAYKQQHIEENNQTKTVTTSSFKKPSLER